MPELCDWPINYSACGATPADPDADPPVAAKTGCKALDNLDAEARENFERMAAQMLWHWTGEIFGVCEVVTRPCIQSCASASRWLETFWGRGPYPWQGRVDSGSWVPLLIGGQWFNMGCGCTGTCSCAEEGPNALRLPGPIVEVTQVRIDGEVIPPAQYQVLYNRLLVRLDGTPWPACQNLLTDASNENTFEVTYKRGVSVPTGGQLAAGILACELAKAACNDSSCQLPQRLQTITRQGVTVGFSDDFRGLDDGKTGIWLIDAWTASVKAPQARAHAGVRSPDVQRNRPGVTTWPRT